MKKDKSTEITIEKVVLNIKGSKIELTIDELKELQAKINSAIPLSNTYWYYPNTITSVYCSGTGTYSGNNVENYTSSISVSIPNQEEGS